MNKKSFFMHYVTKPVEVIEEGWHTLWHNDSYATTVTGQTTINFDNPIPEDVQKVKFRLTYDAAQLSEFSCRVDNTGKTFAFTGTYFYEEESNVNEVIEFVNTSTTGVQYEVAFVKHNQFRVYSTTSTKGKVILTKIEAYY